MPFDVKKKPSTFQNVVSRAFKESKQKSNKRLMAETITKEIKREGQGNAKRRIAHRNLKRERVSPFHGRTLFHPCPL
jgi:hypothetical protein